MQSFLTLTVITIGGLSVSVHDVYLACNRLASVSLTSSSKLTNPSYSLAFLALSLLLNSLYFFLFTSLQFPDNPSFTCPVPFFPAHSPAPLSLFTCGPSLSCKYPQWPCPFVLSLQSTLPALDFDLASFPFSPSGCQELLEEITL